MAIDSGIFLEVSREAHEALAQFRSFQQVDDVPSPIRAEISSLSRAGIFDSSPKTNVNSSTVTSLNLNVCHDCDISCTYCFAGNGFYGEKVKNIPMDIARQAIDLLLSQLQSSKQANVVLFGGEPLLYKDTLANIIEYGRHAANKYERNIIFDIFTNGTHLDEKIGSLLKDDPGIRILISLDGPPGINDRHRRGCGTKGVSRTVCENLKYLDKVPREKIVVRCTVADTEPRIAERAGYFLDIGLTNLVFDPAFCIGVEGIPDVTDIYDAMCDELPAVSVFLAEMIRKRKKVNINLLSETISQILMNNSSAVSSHVEPCPAGRTYLSVDVAGNVYPCHYFVAHREFIIGHIRKDGLKQKNMLTGNGVMNLSRENLLECQECWLRNLCGGPCPYKYLTLYPEEKKFQDAYCRYMRERVKISLGLLSSFYRRERYPYNAQWDSLFQRKGSGL